MRLPCACARRAATPYRQSCDFCFAGFTLTRFYPAAILAVAMIAGAQSAA